MKTLPTLDAISVKISKRNYKRVRAEAKKNGHSISWLLNFVIDLHYQSQESNNAPQPQPSDAH